MAFGVKLGLRFALFFSVIALIVFLIGGNAAFAPKGHPTTERLLAVYTVNNLM